MSDYTPDPYDKTLYEKDQRISELEAALQLRCPQCDMRLIERTALETMLGLEVVVDPSMPPGTVEMRGPHNTVRVEGLESETEVKS